MIRGIVQRGGEACVMGQTRILALDGMMMLICVAAIVVAARVADGESMKKSVKSEILEKFCCISCYGLTHARLCRGRLASGVQTRKDAPGRCYACRTAGILRLGDCLLT